MQKLSRQPDEISLRENLSYFEKIEAKRGRLSMSSTQYIDCRFIPSTSASADRALGAARWVLTCPRKRISPILFEIFLFLKLYRSLWDIDLVSSAMKLSTEERYLSLDDEEFYSHSDN